MRVTTDAHSALTPGERRAGLLQRLAEAGTMQTHGMRCFGYSQRGEIVPEEAALIREAAQRVLRGESLRAISLDWARRQVRTVRGNLWSGRAIKRILLNPRVSGQRVHRGVVVAQGNWTPILDSTDQAKVIAVLTDSNRLTTTHNVGRTPVRVHLLSGGLLRCGLCGAKLVPQPSPSKKPGYACRPGVPINGCGKIRIAARGIEEDVAARVLARLSSPAIRQRLHELANDTGEALTDSIAQVKERMTELTEEWADGTIPRSQWVLATQRLQSRLEEYEAAAERSASIEALPEATSIEDLTNWWETDATLERKRDLIQLLVEHVEVKPATRKGFTGFDPDRVSYIWK